MRRPVEILVAAAALAAAGVSAAVAQADAPPRARSSVSLGVIQTRPLGALGRNIGKGYGIAGNVLLPLVDGNLEFAGGAPARAAVLRAGVLTELGTLGQGASLASSAGAVNELGQVAGTSQTSYSMSGSSSLGSQRRRPWRTVRMTIRLGSRR